MSERPNIVVVITDEERERIWFPDHVRFPNRERLASRGLSFTNHHVHTTPCTPSRSNLFTGRHTDVTGMFDNINFSWQGPMAPSLPTWGSMLRSAGYRTAYKGKWHLGGANRRDGLRAFGFDDWQAPDVHGTPYIGHLVDVHTARRAARWIGDQPRGAGTDPWLLVVGFVNPHDIMLYPRFRKPGVHDHGVELPLNFDDDLHDKPETHRNWRKTCDFTAGRVRDLGTWRMIANAYIDLQLEVDRHLGTVLDAVERRGAADTVVIFTSDHGDMAGAHGLRQKGPFIYRECVNVPLTVAWPGRTDARPLVTDALAAATDLAPTLCHIAGIDPDDARERWSLSGSSLLPLLDDPGLRVRDEVLFTSDAFSSMGPVGPHRGFLRGRTDGRYKVARYFARGDQHASTHHHDLELYDLEQDPYELTNLAAHPASSALLAEQLEALDRLVRSELGGDDRVLAEPRTRLRHINTIQRRIHGKAA